MASILPAARAPSFDRCASALSRTERPAHRTVAGATPVLPRAFPFRKAWLSIDRFSRCANAVMIAVIDSTI
ncbi:hypothetical protein [Burkholderia seminalis]|uniref:hypothetical protein n=1 Tax=Burkholderia seminalis TaxID=488731 RepID=UPI00084EDE8E|nr:hypothetical protein [Burkholderia seminalis]